jgi:hypothetical protein
MGDNMECLFLAGLDNGNYVPVRECPCDACTFSTQVSELSEAWLVANQ